MAKSPKQMKAIEISIKNKKMKMPTDDFAKGAQADENAGDISLDKKLAITKNTAPRIKGSGSLAQALGIKL